MTLVCNSCAKSAEKGDSFYDPDSQTWKPFCHDCTMVLLEKAYKHLQISDEKEVVDNSPIK